MALPEIRMSWVNPWLDTWKVMSLAFKKFFNSEEGNAHKIDWNTAKVLEIRWFTYTSVL
jgi:hypothetical protein